MLPAFSTQTIYTPPPTIVATVIPGNNTVRVPPTNVAPTVSNVQVGNDARGNNTIVALPAPAATPPPVSASPAFYAPFNGAPSTLSASAQTTFFAQLMSQDASPQATGMLAEYENLMALASVKYKPSNATLPEPEPSNVFGRILAQEKQVKVVEQAVAQQAATVTVATTAPKATPAPVRTKEEPKTIARAAPETPAKVSATYQTIAKRPEELREPVNVESA